MPMMWLAPVFSYLSFKDFISVSRVCQRWRQVAMQKEMPQRKITVPITPADLLSVSSAFLSDITTITFTDPIDEATFFRAAPYLVCLEHLDLRGTKVTSSLLYFIFHNLHYFFALKLVDIRDCKAIRDFRPVQLIAQHYNSSSAAIYVRLDKSAKFGAPVKNPTTHPTEITFCNDTADTVYLFWLDYACGLNLADTVEPGKSTTKSTLIAHPWVAIVPPPDGSLDNIVLRVVALDSPQLVKIGKVLPWSLIPVRQTLATADERTSLVVSLHNQTKEVLKLSYIDRQGDEQTSQIAVRPYSLFKLHTHETVPWIIRTESAPDRTFIAAKSVRFIIIKLFAGRLHLDHVSS